MATSPFTAGMLAALALALGLAVLVHVAGVRAATAQSTPLAPDLSGCQTELVATQEYAAGLREHRDRLEKGFAGLAAEHRRLRATVTTLEAQVKSLAEAMGK